jgi:hypothetical protein
VSRGVGHLDRRLEALTGGIRVDFVCGDEAYGTCTKLRQFLEGCGQGYVLRVPCAASASLWRARSRPPAPMQSPACSTTLTTRRQPAQATAALLAAATSLGPVDIRLARDILVEAIVEAQINGQLGPEGTTQTDVAHVVHALPLSRSYVT